MTAWPSSHLVSATPDRPRLGSHVGLLHLKLFSEESARIKRERLDATAVVNRLNVHHDGIQDALALVLSILSHDIHNLYLARSASATSCGSCVDKDSPLCERGMERRAADAAPFLDLLLAVDKDIDRPAEIVQRTAESDHLGMPIGDHRLNDEEVKVAAGTRIAARVRAEHDHTHGRARVLSQGVCCLLDLCVHGLNASD